MKIKTDYRIQLGDRTTPVNLYLNLRDHFSDVKLLECSEYNRSENSHSFIVADELLTFEPILNDTITAQLDVFIDALNVDASDEIAHHIGLFGYSCFEAAHVFDPPKNGYTSDESIPLIQFGFYRYVIVFNHHNNTIQLIENRPEEEISRLDELVNITNRRSPDSLAFRADEKESCSVTDTAFKEMVRKAKGHCQHGDVFQLVLSKGFERKYEGDDLTLYRALRSINPSPYLFYFDYGDFRLMGSSPEAQLVIRDGKAEIHPIAGTYRRTGDDATDNRLAEELTQDPKENSEHVMLVDLARNDLNTCATEVQVTNYKQVQKFSHVIHLVSKVKGNVSDIHPFTVFANSFPAGTLSGAPKHKALELIQKYEPAPRGTYGGAIGMIGLDGSLNMAIMIRSFRSGNGVLKYQAGAGVVIDSDENNELKEVENKIGALRKAIELAQEL